MIRSFLKSLLALSVLTFVISVSAFSAGRGRSWNVRIVTTKGEIVVKLYDETPIHRDNFVKLVKSGYYEGILFHRVINNFMIQSGDPDSKQREPGKLYGDGGPSQNLPAEIKPHIFHKRGVLASAREGDDINPKRESSASQFYIVEGKILDDEALDAVEKRVDKRNSDNNINIPYKISPERRAVYKSIGGTPHLDTQYTVYGEVVSGMEVVESISDVKTDSNDRPIEDIWIISAKAFKKRN